MVLLVFLGFIPVTAQNSQLTGKARKALVVYFSATGTTKAVAEKIAKAAGGDLYEIQPEIPYSDADLDWQKNSARSTIEMHNLAYRPAIKGTVENIQQYDLFYIGFPIWWYQQPTIINTFIEKHNLKGKTVKTFATSGITDIDKADSLLKADYPNIKWVKGKLMNEASDLDIENYVK